VTQDVHLELEELDLESLQDLGDIPLQESGHATGFPSAVLEPHHTHPLEEEHLVTLAGLDELESLPTDFELLPSSPGPEPGAAATPVAHGTAPEPVAKPEPIHSHIPAPEPAAERPTFGHLPSAAVLLGMAGAAGAAGLAAHGLPHETHEPSSEGHGLLAEVHPPAPEPQAPAPQAATIHPAPEPALSAPAPAPATGVLPVEPAAGGQATAAAGHGAPTPEPGHEATEQARAVVQALLADPALMDVLVKALVARTSDQVLREIAWEVMPDLAGRLQR
jgi:hypothetical protein